MAKHFVLARFFSPTTLKWSPRSLPRLHFPPPLLKFLTCIDREDLRRRRTGTRPGASLAQSSLRSSSRLYIVFLRRYKVMPFCDISETRDGRETLQESNSERNTRDLQPGSQGSLLLAP